MTGIAQRISKQTIMRRQTGLGVPGATTGQIIRRSSSIFKATRAMFKSTEVVSHHQSMGSSYGLRATDGTLAGELSAGTYQLPTEAMLEALFATAATLTASDIAAVGDAGGIASFTSGAGAFLTSGFKIGMVVKAVGFTGVATNSNSRNFWIITLVAGTMTGIFLDGALQIADAAGEAVTISEIGKRCFPPLTGHTKDYLEVEEWYGDVSHSDLFNDVMVASLDFEIPASGNDKFSSTYVGLARVLSGVQVETAPNSETTTGIMSGLNSRIYVNGANTPVTSLKISAKNSAAGTAAETGSNSSADISRGVIEVSGSFSSMLRDRVLSTLYEAETEISLIGVTTADQGLALSDFMAFTLGKIKITSDPPDDNASVMRTYAFDARLNPPGALVGANKPWDETIMTVQDSAAT